MVFSILYMNLYISDMISVMVANLVTNKFVAKNFVSTLLQRPLRKFSYDTFCNKSVSNVFGQHCSINGSVVTYKWSELFRCFTRKLVRLPVKNSRNCIAPRKSVMLLSASVFLGYHKDGKVRIFI